jgi:hypothetical protein
MPNVLLEPVTLADGSVSDPAADATEYLMGSGRDWKPAADWKVETLDGETSFPMVSAGSMTADERQALDELALMYLKERFTVVRAEQVLAAGVGDAAGDAAGALGREGQGEQGKERRSQEAEPSGRVSDHGVRGEISVGEATRPGSIAVDRRRGDVAQA